MAQFVPLKIDTDGQNWQAWAAKYRHEGNGIPILYVVRADGELAYAKSGSKQGDELPRFLLEHLATAGVIFSDAQLATLKSAVDDANELLEAGDEAAAVKRMDGLRKLGSLGKLGSHATVARQADTLYLKLVEQGTAALKSAQEQLDGDEPFDGILGVLAANRIYGRLPELRKEMGAAQRDLGKNPAFREPLKQAELLDKALAQLDKKQGAKQAAPALEAIVTRFPGTPAAKIATEKLAALGVDSPPPKGATKPTAVRTWTDATGGFRVEAEFVGLADGKVQLKRNDGKVITVPLDKLSEADQRFISAK